VYDVIDDAIQKSTGKSFKKKGAKKEVKINIIDIDVIIQNLQNHSQILLVRGQVRKS